MTGLALVVLAAVAAAEDAPDYRGYVDKARFLVKKQLFQEAKRELEQAVATEDGRLDPEAWYLLASVHYELADLEAARLAADRAHSTSRSDEQLQLAAGLADFLRQQFGILVLSSSHAGTTTRLKIELESVLFDPNLKLYLKKVEARHHEPAVLPVRVGLPAGTYRVNGQQVTVPPSGQASLELSRDAIQGGGALALAQAELAFGVSALFGRRVEAMLPAPDLQLAVSQPVGPLVAGVMVDWSPRTVRTAIGTLETLPAAFTVGARVGWELPGLDPLVVRPSIGYRYGQLPGVELACQDQGEGWGCSDGGEAELYVYGVGTAHVPLVEVAVGVLDRRRSTALGYGIKGVVEHAFGALPADAEAKLGGERVGYAVEDEARRFSSTGLRLLANLTLAF